MRSIQGESGSSSDRQIWRSSEGIKSWKSFGLHVFRGFHTWSEKEVELLKFQSMESNLDRRSMKGHVSADPCVWETDTLEGRGHCSKVRKYFVALKSRGDIDHCLQQTRGRISYLLRFFSLRFLKYVCQ
jgi:hypothetical protein